MTPEQATDGLLQEIRRLKRLLGDDVAYQCISVAVEKSLQIESLNTPVLYPNTIRISRKPLRKASFKVLVPVHAVNKACNGLIKTHT